MDDELYKSNSGLPHKARKSIDQLFQLTKGNAYKAQDLVLKKISKLINSINRTLDIPKSPKISKNSFELSKSLVLGCKRILYVLKTEQIKSQPVTTGLMNCQEGDCVRSDLTQQTVPQMTKIHKGSQVEGDIRIKSEVIRHIIDHQGVTEYQSGMERNEVQDQIGIETATFDRKMEQSKVMDQLSESHSDQTRPWLSQPITKSQQQRARIQVLFGMATADEYISKVCKEAQLRDYLLDHIHNKAEKKVKESSLHQDFSNTNQRKDPEYSKQLQDKLMAIKNAKIEILREIDKGELTLSPDQLKIQTSARRLWFADQNEQIHLSNDVQYIKDNHQKTNNFK